MVKLFSRDNNKPSPSFHTVTTLLTDNQIAQRAAREAREGDRVYIDQGIASKVKDHLPPNVSVSSDQKEATSVDVSFLSAIKVDQRGIGFLAPSNNGRKNESWTEIPVRGSRQTVILISHSSIDIKDIISQSPIQDNSLNGGNTQCLLITNTAVFDLEKDGVIVRELADGVSAIEIQKHSDILLFAGPDLCAIEV